MSRIHLSDEWILSILSQVFFPFPFLYVPCFDLTDTLSSISKCVIFPCLCLLFCPCVNLLLSSYFLFYFGDDVLFAYCSFVIAAPPSLVSSVFSCVHSVLCIYPLYSCLSTLSFQFFSVLSTHCKKDGGNVTSEVKLQPCILYNDQQGVMPLVPVI